MEDELHKQVISQHEHPGHRQGRAQDGPALKTRNGRSARHLRRPDGGEDAAAKRLAGFMSATENALVQIDMSEYMEEATTSAADWAPPGTSGMKRRAVDGEDRRRPYSVCCWTIEKRTPTLRHAAPDHGKKGLDR